MCDIMPTLTVGDFEKSRYNNECLAKLLIRNENVEKLEWRRGFADLNKKKCGGGQRMPDKDNFNAVCEEYAVRRLTPTECARLQGMPDDWCRLSHIGDMTDADYEFWCEVLKTHAEVNGKAYKKKSKSQMIAWYNKLHTDSAEYKAYGNGMALPCVRVPIHGIAEHGVKTMASLFDGIGGFPLAGILDGIETLWTAEIEPFPIAVTKERFTEYEEMGRFTYGNQRK